MSNLLKTGLAYLTAQLTTHAAETVTYARGYDSVEVRAVFNRQAQATTDAEGVRLEWTDMEFSIPTADLNFDGERITPRRGDLIYVTEGYDVSTYEVRPLAGLPPWSWDDPYGSMLRVRTKRVDA